MALYSYQIGERTSFGWRGPCALVEADSMRAAADRLAEALGLGRVVGRQEQMLVDLKSNAAEPFAIGLCMIFEIGNRRSSQPVSIVPILEQQRDAAIAELGVPLR